jgi:hypothetical protein
MKKVPFVNQKALFSVIFGMRRVIFAKASYIAFRAGLKANIMLLAS